MTVRKVPPSGHVGLPRYLAQGHLAKELNSLRTGMAGHQKGRLAAGPLRVILTHTAINMKSEHRSGTSTGNGNCILWILNFIPEETITTELCEANTKVLFLSNPFQKKTTPHCGTRG